ncbi:membrane-anchored ubiquitin-fold protein 1-like [Olea europaea var. sylvestris]|nr:membrane-anchored ubiquitin-fold protein 1-like [Olea europaea var. sylvestris]
MKKKETLGKTTKEEEKPRSRVLEILVFRGLSFWNKLKMSGAEDQMEIKFRLIDGSDIGPKIFPTATSVATLKENIIAQWPKEKENGPRTVKDIKLISAGRILENNRTVEDCRSPLYDIPGVVTTMHVVVRTPAMEVKKSLSDSKQNKCGCVIL